MGRDRLVLSAGEQGQPRSGGGAQQQGSGPPAPGLWLWRQGLPHTQNRRGLPASVNAGYRKRHTVNRGDPRISFFPPAQFAACKFMMVSATIYTEHADPQPAQRKKAA